MPTEAETPRVHPLSIAYVSPGWPPSILSNGIATYVEHMRLSLCALGHRPMIFTARVGESNLPAEVVQIHSRKPGPLARLARSAQYRIHGQRAAVRWYAESLRKALLAQHQDSPIHLVEVEESFGIARHLLGRVPFPVVVRMHGPACIHGKVNPAGTFHDQWRLTVERDAIVSADGLSSPSASLLYEVRQAIGHSLPNACVIPNPAPAVGLQPAWDPGSHEPGKIVFIGRIDRTKGFDVLLSAFAQVRQHNRTATLTVIGKDHGVVDSHGEQLNFHACLDRFLPNPHDHSRVEYLGPQPSDRLNEWRRQAAIVVVPSRYENFPNVLLEAMAVGAPVAASRIGGISEIIRHHETGLLVEPGNAESLAGALLWLLDHPAESASMGQAARASCTRRFDPVAVASQQIEFYRSVIDRVR